MRFFCPITGVRLIAPGTSPAGGGTVPVHDGSALHEAAALAAWNALVAARLSPTESAPSPTGLAKAVDAALAVVTAPALTPPAPAPAPAPERRRPS